MRWSGLLLFLLLVSCRKEPAREAPIRWEVTIAEAERLAAKEERPVVVFLGATWDMASKELERHTFVDREVERLMKGYIALRIDVSDDESPSTRAASERFKVVGTPTVIVYAPDMKTELHRINEFVKAEQMASILRYASESRTGITSAALRDYDSLRPVIDRVRSAVLDHPLMDPSRTAPYQLCNPTPPEAAAACERANEVRRNQLNSEQMTMNETVLPSILAGTPIVSLEITRFVNHESRWASTGPRRVPQLPGTRNAEVGVALSQTRTLGWGRYHHVDAQDASAHPGIELLERTETVGASTYVRMVILTDSYRRPTLPL